MLVEAFPAGPWATNCYVVAPGPREECVVIDPGFDAASGVADVVREHGLRPAAVLLTHGHIDHVWCVVPVAGAYDAAAYLHTADRHLLTDPLAGLAAEWRGLLQGGVLGAHYAMAEPSDVRPLSDGERLTVAGLELVVDETPGHTRGSVTFRTSSGSANGDGPVLFSGDLLFAGSIGRTDLPGGDPEAMQRSLAAKVLPLPDEMQVLPGHGPQTTIGQERATNPFLVGLETVATSGPPEGRR